jgi:acetylornithine/succinyldiaminopimelate/putrescine aminotransferase/predicted amino acid dehydrogenase
VLGLDAVFERGCGSLLYERDSDIAVLDFLGGYGSCFFGHNHPSLKQVIVDFLHEDGVVHAQASIRRGAEQLCCELSARLRASLHDEYEIVLANTGAEAVEVAAKHADQAYFDKRQHALEWVAAGPDTAAIITWTAAARATLRKLGIPCDDASLQRIRRHNRLVLDSAPLQVALQGSFHGMTARALELTHDPEGRFGKRLHVSTIRFIDPASRSSLSELLTELTQPLLRPVRRGEEWDLELREWTQVTAVFVEPIQGEGGIHPIDAVIAQTWLRECRKRSVPLVADEIQSGMGRTGTFLHCEQLGVQPDYVLLGKSLGGGLAKISAIAIRRDLVVPGFGLRHMSTFAEDELSARVALGSLALLDCENALGAAAVKGQLLLSALRGLAERHPGIIHEVRGCGLLIGVEWEEQSFDRSHALRFQQRYGWLGYAFAGYLLRAHALRVAPTLSRRTTLRLEPAYSIPTAAIERLISGLDALCILVEQQDAAGILGPCLGLVAGRRQRPSPPATIKEPLSSHVAFIGHFIDPEGVAQWDPSFTRLPPDGCARFLEKLRPFAEPLETHRDHVRSITGAATTVSFIGIPVSSQQCYDALRTPERHSLRDLVQRAVDLAAEEGCSVVGLGGYTAILTRNGKDLRPHGLAVTTGNGFTVGAGLHALKSAAHSQRIVWERASAAVVGATGNIGSICAELLASEVGSVILLGRTSRLSELEAMAARIAGQIGGEARITVGTDLALCRGAQLIVTTSNQARSILFPEHLGDAPTVIIDLAVPGDVDASVARERPDVRVIRGGVIRTPCNPDWHVPGIPLGPGEMFACMTETVLMGFEGARAHGSYGSLSVNRVLHTMELSRKHGFLDIRLNADAWRAPDRAASSRGGMSWFDASPAVATP